MHDAGADAGQAGQPSKVSAVVCLIVWCEGGRGGGRPATRLGDHAAQMRTQRTSVGGSSRGAADAARGGGLCGAAADAGETGQVPSVVARISLSSKYL